MKNAWCLLTSIFVSAPVFAAAESGAHTLNQSPLSAVNLLQTILGLALVLACIVAVAWLLKRTNRFHTAANGKLKVIAGIALGTRERLVLVQVGEEQLLLGVTAQQINTLHKLETPLSEAESSTPNEFANKLRQFMQRGDA
ncbi:MULTISPECIES: flagellar biosynthetic protein FliO [unclassified Methylophaga]|uniref:flagellar biosynthetic protein FliO n=1 Tax=unclassified Methylophaga TaxID=2629249 RepID=UPI000C42202C|nr:flagellar biosynthetic protein FliO [Methylophaga sp. UBA678]MAX52530.1 flagellar biosynthetic protein FliO [Methylophaga sp.]|tara:strand:+ start:41975 stop:42397 length:423 start_codon:yes stop_codon:yes gene_type:complete